MSFQPVRAHGVITIPKRPVRFQDNDRQDLMAGASFIDFHLRTRIVFGTGTLTRLAPLAGELGFTRTLVVADEGIVATGYVETVAALLRDAGSAPSFFHRFDANPDSDMVEAGRTVPSLPALQLMVDRLEIPMSVFFDEVERDRSNPS